VRVLPLQYSGMNRRPQNRRLPLMLPGDIYALLEEQALRADRDPIQQARWILRRVLLEEPLETPAEVVEPEQVP
jgi:hypothetical protein